MSEGSSFEKQNAFPKFDPSGNAPAVSIAVPIRELADGRLKAAIEFVDEELRARGHRTHR